FTGRKEIPLDPPVANQAPPLPSETAGELPESQWGDRECRLPGGFIMRKLPNDPEWGVRLFNAKGETVRHFAKDWVVAFDCTADGKTLAPYGPPPAATAGPGFSFGTSRPAKKPAPSPPTTRGPITPCASRPTAASW